jgi:hypothetical protein
MREMKNACKIFGRKALKGRDHLEDPSVDGRVTLNWILEMMWTGRIRLRTETSCGLL